MRMLVIALITLLLLLSCSAAIAKEGEKETEVLKHPFLLFKLMVLAVVKMMRLIDKVGLDLLLRGTWIAGILPIIIASIPISTFHPLHNVVLSFAKRGKILRLQSSTSYKYTVPQRFFLHFYVVAVVWTTILLLLTWFYAYRKVAALGLESLHYSTVASHLTGGSHVFSFNKPQATRIANGNRVWRAVFLLLMMEVQALRRLYETLNVLNYSLSARMHIFAYLIGLFFYIAAPLSLCSNCAPEVFRYTANQVIEFVARGRGQIETFEFDLRGYMKPLTNLGFLQWVGAAIAIWGWIHQHRCHAILGSLQEQKENAEEYVIPHGDWFKYVSSPHYLAEIVIYAGFLVASGGSDLTVWLLFAFVVFNLTLTAAETHRWYHHKFDNYPVSRRAILPFVY